MFAGGGAKIIVTPVPQTVISGESGYPEADTRDVVLSLGH